MMGGSASPSASCPSLSPFLSSEEMANIWRTSWPKSTLLDSSSLESRTSISLSFTFPNYPSSSVAQKSSGQPCSGMRKSNFVVATSTSALFVENEHYAKVLFFLLQFSRQGLDWQVSSMAHWGILNQSSAILSNVGHLSIHAHRL